MCMMFCLHIPCVSNALKPAVGARDHRTGVTGGCEPPCGCWKLNPGLLQEPQILWISEPSVRFPLIQALKQTSLASEQTCFTFAAGSTCSPSYRHQSNRQREWDGKLRGTGQPCIPAPMPNGDQHSPSSQSLSRTIQRALEYRLGEKIYLVLHQHFVGLLAHSTVAMDMTRTSAKDTGHPPRNTTAP